MQEIFPLKILIKIVSRIQNNAIELELIKPNEEDSLLRAMVEEEDKYNAFDILGERFTTVLFPPVRGGLSSSFDPRKQTLRCRYCYATELTCSFN